MRSSMRLSLHLLQIEGSVSTSNMTLFNKEGMIETYATPEAIMEVFYEARIQGYEDRKNYLVDKLNKEFRKLDNKVKTDGVPFLDANPFDEKQYSCVIFFLL